ncbi:MAG: glycoside hydrolase [Chloroflexi bacterium]|nr:glycoside hydrolase [Chloroflexota bacterium]
MAFVVVFASVCLAGLSFSSAAQSGEDAWAPPANLSTSGAASLPAIAVATDGSLHALWWDSVSGEQYSFTGVTDTNWSSPVAVPAILSERRVDTDTQTGKVSLTLVPPREIRLQAVDNGVLALWFNKYNELYSARLSSAARGAATLLADAALRLDVSMDVSNTLHLAYLRPLQRNNTTAGIYYRSSTGVNWSVATQVYSSTYFRTLQPEQAHLSVAGDPSGAVLVAWDDPRDNTSFYARSADRGVTWSDPQQVLGPEGKTVTKAYLAALGNSGFMMYWQDLNSSGCTLVERRSTDGGQTWGSPQRIEGTLTRCPAQWSPVQAGDGRLWLIGTPRLVAPSTTGANSSAATQVTQDRVAMLTAWDGKAWTELLPVSLEFYDSVSRNNVQLGCMRMALHGQRLVAAGCSAGKDIWVTTNVVGLEQLLPALKPNWSAYTLLSDRSATTAVEGVPALATDRNGNAYAMWSLGDVKGEHGIALRVATWNGTEWSQMSQPIRSPSNVTIVGEVSSSKAEQPSLSVDTQGRLHVVWSGGANGNILYSRVRTSDVLVSTAWTDAVVIPAPSNVNSWPDIIADPRGPVLYVLYAVPFNEKRGIYMARSDDAGETWTGPAIVADAVASGWSSVDKPRLALDAQSNVLHAVWLRAELPGGTNPQAVFYARSTDGGQTWSEPVKVAEGSVDWPRVAVIGEGQVYLVWSQLKSDVQMADGGGIDAWGQVSVDGGQRWQEPKLVRGFEGLSGPVGLTTDGAGQAHLVAMGQGSNGSSELLYSQWTGQAWDAVERFSLGQSNTSGNSVAVALSTHSNRLVALLREWIWGQSSEGQFEVASMMRGVKAVQLVPVPTFTPVVGLTATVEPTPVPTPTVRPKPEFTVDESSRPSGGSLQSSTVLIVSAVLTIVIVIGAITVRVVTGTRH